MKKLQESSRAKKDNRNSIVRVKGRLDFVSPPRSREEREREEETEREIERERRESRRDRSNGVEETFCSLRLKENIGDPSRADIYTPQAGRINNVNNFNLPILSHLKLSAERGFLYNNAIYAPHWNLNAHSVVYVIKGRARTQIVDENGNNLLNNEVRQGQLFVIPQNHAVLCQAGNEGFEYVAFKTNENAQSATLAGKLSVFRALPESVISSAFQVSREQARRLKYNREEATLLSSRSSSSEEYERRAVA
uniref:11S globulin seed storage protein n=1 Tax=Eleusine coracana subsp. coracana TaxID=191504 RepID=A0A6G8MUU4_ELECO|nr:11S globulin seed storage protein [Eleusine coracana subsp. coracana]